MIFQIGWKKIIPDIVDLKDYNWPSVQRNFGTRGIIMQSNMSSYAPLVGMYTREI